MRGFFIILILAFLFSSCSNKISQEFIASDINNFWEAYAKISQTEDTLLQLKYLNEFYLGKGSSGLNDIIKAKRYSEKDFLTAINDYPKFWNSIKSNTSKTKRYQKEISKDIKKLKKAYPLLKPSPIYFTIGALRSNGTTMGNNVLIGSELALADNNTVINELPDWRQPFFKEYKPLENLALLCTHEYIHTQQKEIVHELLLVCLYEGVAEYISCKVTGKASSCPAINFGKKNETLVVTKFIEDLYLGINDYNWIWGTNKNELKVRDLGYYIGYEICERYYETATNKKQAIKDLIELDYENTNEVERIVDKSGLLPKPVSELTKEFENKRPTVISIDEFENGSKKVNPNTNKITVNFSEVLGKNSTGLDFGPLGKSHYPSVDNNSRKWGPNNKSYSFNVQLEPNKKYQLIISNFSLENGIRIKPYLIEFSTSNTILTK